MALILKASEHETAGGGDRIRPDNLAARLLTLAKASTASSEKLRTKGVGFRGNPCRIDDWEFLYPLSFPSNVDLEKGRVFPEDLRRDPWASRPVPKSIYGSQLAVDPGDDRQCGIQAVPSHSDVPQGIRANTLN